MSWFSKSAGGFIAIPSQILSFNLSTSELSVYLAIAKYANAETGECWPSQYSLCEDLGWFYTSADGTKTYSNNRISKALQALKKLGLVQVQRRRNNSSILRLMPLKSPVAKLATGAVPRTQAGVSTSPKTGLDALTVQDVQAMSEEELYSLLDSGCRPSNPEVDDAILRKLNPELFEDEAIIPDSLGATADYNPGTFYEPVDFSDDEIFAS